MTSEIQQNCAYNCSLFAMEFGVRISDAWCVRIHDRNCRTSSTVTIKFTVNSFMGSEIFQSCIKLY